MSRRSIVWSFFAATVAVALGSSTQPAGAGDGREVALSAQTEAIPAAVPGDNYDLVGCVFDAKTGRKLEGPFVVRIFLRSGTGFAALRYGGCYDGMSLGDATPQEWDFIEVLYEKDGRLYSQQRKLSSTASPIGFNYLGVAENTLRYDFFLDIVQSGGRNEDATDR
jgi:hypothetical protein